MTKRYDYTKSLKCPSKSGIAHFNDLYSFFLYYSPGVDSILAHSRLSSEDSIEIFNKFLRKNIIIYEIKKKDKSDLFSSVHLDGCCIEFESNRFAMIEKGFEDDLLCLLRHIRNSLAHGYFYSKCINHIYKLLFVDYEIKTKKDGSKIRKLTAKILIDFNALVDLKNMIDEKLM